MSEDCELCEVAHDSTDEREPEPPARIEPGRGKNEKIVVPSLLAIDSMNPRPISPEIAKKSDEGVEKGRRARTTEG
ncbi:hypothetical protein N658DRAFT_492323 [Parathielavia hyrcaniae]|uniref:Uncharacterized protein n=1 Tax=Parathielavia hyrcaniae TaxID=113614 RepID=A0AAN6QA94_9PEZI|nr:hypothetical protein N658DRAFT_492323 [Parathielavia hyrcaniae]